MMTANAPQPAGAGTRLLWLWLLVGGGLGIAIGSGLGERAAPLGDVAVLFIKILKVLATPLVFFAVLETVMKTSIPGRKALTLIAISTTNAIVAICIAWTTSTVLPVGSWLSLDRLQGAIGHAAKESSGPIAQAARWLDHLLIANILLVIAAAVVLGLLLRRLGKAPPFIGAALRVLMRILHGIVLGVPVAVACILAKVVGSSGFAIFPALGLFVLVVAVGMFVQVFLYYSLLIRWLLSRSPVGFLRSAAMPLMTAMSTGSSLATLPVTLRSLERAGVSDESARLAACVGTNLNHDGILLYEAMAAFFVAELYAIPLATGAKLKVMVTAVAAAVGIAGVPEAGLITLAMVLGAVGLPLSAVPLLLPVDWLLGRMRATVNVASDLVVATLLDRSTPPAARTLSP